MIPTRPSENDPSGRLQPCTCVALEWCPSAQRDSSLGSVYNSLLALLLFSQNAIAHAGSTGRICIASIEPPNDQPKSLGNPSGGNPDISYSLRIDDRPTVRISHEKGRWIEGLPIDTKLPVVIYEDGERAASFFVELDKDERSKCIFLNTLYLTWRAWNWNRTGPWCDCPKTEASAEDSADRKPVYGIPLDVYKMLRHFETLGIESSEVNPDDLGFESDSLESCITQVGYGEYSGKDELSIAYYSCIRRHPPTKAITRIGTESLIVPVRVSCFDRSETVTWFAA